MEDAEMIRELENLHVLNTDFHNMDALVNALEESIGKERSGRFVTFGRGYQSLLLMFN